MSPASLLLLMCLLLPQALSGHQGGPSQTNGNLATSLEPSLAHTIQKLLVSRLGLQSLPNPSLEARVAQYLLDLYQFHTQQYHLIEDPKFSYPSQHMQGANTIRCFYHTESTTPQRSPEEKNEATDSIHIGFNLSSIPSDESVVSAELRFLHEGSGESSHMVSVYLSNSDPESKPKLLHSRRLTRDTKTTAELWETFPLQGEVLQRISDKSGSLSFIVDVVADNSSLPKDRHLRVSRSPGQDEPSWAKQRPLLVTYSHDGHSEPFLSRKKRTPASQRGRGRWTGGRYRADRGLGLDARWQGGWNERRVKRNKGRAAKLKHLSRARCRRHPLYVDFKDVGLHKWIVAPAGYHAFLCLGECRFPLADHMNSSTHAIVQTLVNSVNGAVPRACCVPTALSPIALLYMDHKDHVVLKNSQEMVVEGCGCR